jgi:transposase
MDLTDAQWWAIHFQMPPLQPWSGGLAPDPRRLLDGIFWKIRSDSPWCALPTRYPSHQSCHHFYAELQSSGLLKSLVQSLYSDLVYRGDFTPYQAFVEKRIMLRTCAGSIKFYLDPGFIDDWRTLTALLCMQFELHEIQDYTISAPDANRLESTGVKQLAFRFSAWPKFAPLRLDGKKIETYSAPEDIILRFWYD